MRLPVLMVTVGASCAHTLQQLIETSKNNIPVFMMMVSQFVL